MTPDAATAGEGRPGRRNLDVACLTTPRAYRRRATVVKAALVAVLRTVYVHSEPAADALARAVRFAWPGFRGA